MRMPFHLSVNTRLHAAPRHSAQSDGRVAWRSQSEEEQKALIAELHKLKTDLFMDIVESGRIPIRPGVARLMSALQLSTGRPGTHCAVALLTKNPFLRPPCCFSVPRSGPPP